MEKQILITKVELNKLNFDSLIQVDTVNVEEYSFNEYQKNGKDISDTNGRHRIKQFCTLCETDNCSKSHDPKKEGRLITVSHGAHSIDFFEASKFSPSDDWHTEPIMFVLENPGPQHCFYLEMSTNGFVKSPSEEWYFIHGVKDHNPVYPENFEKKMYGKTIHSIINTFRLKNAYVTNAVKCGMYNSKDKFMNTIHYTEPCKINCIERYLSKEVEIMNPRIIFTFGKNTKWMIENYSKIKGRVIVNLPHPANWRISNINFANQCFDEITKQLHENGIINDNEHEKLMKMRVQNNY